jgi:hypothetical protein
MGTKAITFAMPFQPAPERPEYVSVPGKNKTPRAGFCLKIGAGNETRTRDPDLGKVVLYQLSYSRKRPRILRTRGAMSTLRHQIATQRGLDVDRAAAPRALSAALHSRACSAASTAESTRRMPAGREQRSKLSGGGNLRRARINPASSPATRRAGTRNRTTASGRPRPRAGLRRSRISAVRAGPRGTAACSVRPSARWS